MQLGSKSTHIGSKRPTEVCFSHPVPMQMHWTTAIQANKLCNQSVRCLAQQHPVNLRL